MIRHQGRELIEVLIVAKCIVNKNYDGENLGEFRVLIVAKCIVNFQYVMFSCIISVVLIVAKCIVNLSTLKRPEWAPHMY